MDRPWGPFVPDAPDFESPGLTTGSKNAIPLDDEQQSYGPLPGLSAISDALAATAVGATTANDVDGNVSTFAGTAAGLFQLATGGAWSDVSQSGGYTLSAQETWNFVTFGNLLIAAGDLGQKLQVFDLDGGALFEDLSPDAPNARYIATVRDFVMVGSTFYSDQGSRPDQVAWSAIGVPSSWPTPGSSAASAAQSGRQVLPDSGSVQSIQSGIGGADACIFCQDRIWRVNYEGPPTVFRFDPVERARGAYVPGAVVAVGSVAFYLARDGFYRFDGANSTPVGMGAWDKFVLDDLDVPNKNRMTAAVDKTRKLIFWAYPGSGNTGGRPNKLLIYNYATGRAMPAEIDVQLLGSFRSAGYTLDDLDAFGTLDALTISLDSPIWAGGGEYIGAIGSDGKLSEFSGSHLEATFRTNQFGGERAFLSGVRPFINSDAVTVSVRSKADFGGSTTATAFVAPGADSFAPFRVAGRYFAIETKVAAASSWPSSGKSQGVDIRLKREGVR
jgi:hypothetical protein